jgi:hypothetical protein
LRLLSLITAMLALFMANAANAQDWGEYSNRDNFFTVNFPGDPVEKDVPYKTAKGTNLTAHVFTAAAPADTLLAGTYSVTVVDYSSALSELPMAMEEAAAAMRAKGTVKYDGSNNVDQMASWRQTIETDNRRILSEILTAANNRLYIVAAETALSTPPPAQFQASVQILDENGVRIRYKTVGSTERVR